MEMPEEQRRRMDAQLPGMLGVQEHMKSVAIIEHRENARIVRLVDVSQYPHGTLLYPMEDAMSVRAKVRCNAKTGQEVHFTTVYETDEARAKDPENVRFTEATPWGDI